MDILRHLDNPGDLFSRVLKKLAPRGWNANTQFFLIFLGILGVHLWALPTLMRSAGMTEPGDLQGYFTSGHQSGQTDVADRGTDEVKTSAETKPEPAKSEKLIKETLVLTDPPLVASPIEAETAPETEESAPPAGETREKSEPTEVADQTPAEKVDPISDPLENGKEKVEAEAPPSVASTKPRAQPIEAEEKAAEVATTRREPTLSDLVTEANAIGPPATEENGLPRIRAFRSLH